MHNKNLKIIDFAPHFKSALGENLFLIEELKNYLESEIDDLVVKGKNSKVIVFADADWEMCELKLFDKSEILGRR